MTSRFRDLRLQNGFLANIAPSTTPMERTTSPLPLAPLRPGRGAARSWPVLLPMLALLLQSGCGPQPASGPRTSEMEPSSLASLPAPAAEDHFPDKADIRHATGFAVTYHGHYKVVRVAAEAGALRLSDREGAACPA